MLVSKMQLLHSHTSDTSLTLSPLLPFSFQFFTQWESFGTLLVICSNSVSDSWGIFAEIFHYCKCLLVVVFTPEAYCIFHYLVRLLNAKFCVISNTMTFPEFCQIPYLLIRFEAQYEIQTASYQQTSPQGWKCVYLS